MDTVHRKLVGRIVFCIATLFISACAPVVKTNITVFHELPQSAAPTTYAFILNDENDLEALRYAEEISVYLNRYNYRRVHYRDDPDLVVFFTYGISDGTTTSGTTPIFGQTGGGITSHSGNANTTYQSAGNRSTSNTSYSGTSYSAPTYGVVGAIPYTSTSYTRFLFLDIYRTPTSEEIEKNDLHKVYQAQVTSTGSGGQINMVMNEMIDSLFEEFPGESGKSRTERR